MIVYHLLQSADFPNKVSIPCLSNWSCDLLSCREVSSASLDWVTAPSSSVPALNTSQFLSLGTSSMPLTWGHHLQGICSSQINTASIRRHPQLSPYSISWPRKLIIPYMGTYPNWMTNHPLKPSLPPLLPNLISSTIHWFFWLETCKSSCSTSSLILSKSSPSLSLSTFPPQFVPSLPPTL